MLSITPDDLCVPSKGQAPFTREGWIFELKYDGFRIIATHRGRYASLLTRRGTDFTEQFPELVTELRQLPDVVLDCELVMLDDQGVPRFESLVRRSRLKRRISIDDASRTRPAVLFAFDVLAVGDVDVRSLPLLERKAMMQRDVIKSAGRVRPTGYFTTEGVKLFQIAAQTGFEGIVAKRADSRYRRGPSNDWIKIKTSIGRAIDEERASWHEHTTNDEVTGPRKHGGRFGRRRNRLR